MTFNKYYEKALEWSIIQGPKILIGLIVFLIGQWLIKVIKNWTGNFISAREINSSLAPFLQSLITSVLQVLLIIAVMQIMGIQMTIFAALIASLGVAAGLALSGTLQNFACGVLILLLKPFKVGDNIIAQGHEGIVASIQIFYTILKTLDNRTVIVPNGKLSNEVIINLSREGIRRLDLEVKFPFTTDMQHVEEVIAQSVKSSTYLLKDPAFKMGIASIDPDGYKVLIEVWVDALSYYNIRTEFFGKILQEFKNAQLR